MSRTRRRVTTRVTMQHETLADVATTIVNTLAALSVFFETLSPQDMLAVAAEAQRLNKIYAEATPRQTTRAAYAFSLAAMLATAGVEYDEPMEGGPS